MYGLGLCELRYLDGKHVFVQRGNTESFIDIQIATALLSTHPSLSALSFPTLSLVTMLVPSTDAPKPVSDPGFVCPDGHLLKMISGEFQCIKEEAWIRLVTAVYYSKFKKFFRSKSINHTF